MYMEVGTHLMVRVYHPLSQTEVLFSFDIRKQALGLRIRFSFVGFPFLPPLRIALCCQVCLAVPLYDIKG